MRKISMFMMALMLFLTTTVFGQLSGTKNIPGDYATLTAAIADLNTQGVGTGGVTFNVAAGYTETLTAPLSITATGTLTTPIVFQKSGLGANPLITAYLGTATPASAVQDGIWNLVGSDYVTIDGFSLIDPNITNPETMEYGFAMFKASATDGCQYNTIKNCVVTLNSLNNVSGTAPAVDGSRAINIMNALVTAQISVVTPTAASGTNSYNKIYTNTLQNCNYGIALIGYAGATPFTLCDYGNDIGGTSALTGNSILNYGGAPAAANPSAGIRTLAQYDLNISYNTVNNNNGSGVNHPNTLRGIYVNTAISASASITHNNLTIYGGGTTNQVSVIENVSGSTAASNTVNITNNTITGAYSTATTGSFYGIYNTGTPATLNVTDNAISTISTPGTGALYGMSLGGPTTLNISNNNVSSLTKTGIGLIYGIQSGTAILTCQNNVIDGLSCTATSATTVIYGIYNGASAVVENYLNNIVKNITTTTSGNVAGLYINSATGNKTIKSNQFFNFTTSGAGTVMGIWMAYGLTDTLSNNTLYNYTTTGATAGTIYGIRITAGTTNNIYNNTIYTLSNSNGTTGSIYGISFTSGTTNNLFKNKIYDLASGSTGPSVYGIYFGGGTTNNTYNNFVSDLRAPAANTANPINGIYVSSGSTNLYFNTIYLNASSTGATFGTTGIYASTTPTVDIRNNIVVNKSTPGATGYTVAYRRSGTTLTSYASTSNNNCFYAGVADTNKLVFFDGTTKQQTISDFKTLVSPKDGGSFAENVPFVNSTTAPYDLHVSTTIATYCESGATANATVTDDIDDNSRGSVPDVGADEFAGIAAGVVNPTMVASVVNSQQISLAITPNVSTNNVVIVWNATGTFTSPSGTPPTNIGDAFAGGSLLYNGTTSPVLHSGLTVATTYYYKAFSYDGTNYSSGATTNATTNIAAPTAFTATATSSSQINLTWTKNAANSDVIIATKSTSTFGSPVNGTTYAVNDTLVGGAKIIYNGPLALFNHTSLTSATTYYYKAWSVDTYSAYSTTGLTSNATTLCSIASIPTLSQGFEAATLPVCWSTGLVSGTTNWASTTSNDGVPSPHTGTYFMGKSYTTSDALIYSQPIDMTTSASGARVNVWIYRSASNLATDRIRFHINTTQSLTGATQLLEVFPLTTVAPTVTAAGWYQYIVNIPSSYNTNSTVYIIAQGTTSGGFSSYGMGFDDFVVEAIPACPAPLSTSLTATAITANGATLGWAAGGTETAWTVEYGVTGFTQGTGTIVNVTTTPSTTLTGLTQNTSYQFYVKAKCSASDSSALIGPKAFTTPFSCPKPTTLTATSITSSSAVLGWTAGGAETAWILYYKAVSATDYTEVTGVTANTYTLNGLNAATDYVFAVKANCAANDTSYLTSTKAFSTACGAVSILPWTEGFESGYVQGNTIAKCWSQFSTTGTGTWLANNTNTTYNRTPRTGSWNATLGYGNEDWLFYQFSLTGGQSYTFEMYARQDYATTVDANITVSYGDSGTVTAMTHPIIASTGLTNGNYQKLTGAFIPATSGTYYIGIKGYMSSSPWYISIDDIKLNVSPVCLEPTALNTSAISAHDATIGWTAGGTETAWNVEYGASGFTLGTGTLINATTNSATISDLTQNTAYSFYVQADCGIANGQSAWVGPFTFTTPYSCPKPTVPTVVGITSTSANLGWTAGGTETNWIVYYKEATATNYTEVTGVTTNPYTLNGLTPATNYIFKVKANCAANDTSYVSATKTFTTACLTYSTFPFTESFSTLFPACWTASEGSTGASYHWESVTADATNGVSGPKNGTNFMRLNVYNASTSYNPYYLTSPVFNLDATPKQLQYYYFLGSGGYSTTPVPLTVQISTDNGTTWTDLVAHTSTNSTLSSTNALAGWTKNIINLTAYANQTAIFRFVSNSNYGSGICNQGIDEFNIQNIPTCPEPSVLTATSITSTSATLGWTAGGTETAWTLYYKEATATNYTQVNGVTNPYTLNGLNSGTAYLFKVKANCSATDTSTTTSALSFNTNCGTVSTINENFDAITTPALPNCWSKYISSSYTYETVNTYATSPYSAPNCVQLYSSGASALTDAPMLISPMISNLTAGNKQLRFYAKGASTNTSVIVGTMTDPTNSSTFTPFSTVTGLSTSAWNEYTVSFATYAGTDQYIAFRHPLTTTYSYIYLDDIYWETIPSCYKPTALNATNSTLTGATLEWTAGGTETAWKVQYGLSGFALGTGTVVPATTNSLTLTTLTSSSTYQFYVQSQCSATDSSTWAGPFSFSTLCGSVDIPYTQNFDGVTAPALPNCITVTNDNNDTYLWVTAAGTANSSPNAMRIGYNGSLATDDWFYTPGLNLIAGKTYNLKFYYRGSGATFPEKLEVKYGTAASAAAMTSAQVFNNANVINSAYEQGTGSFTVASSGVYYVGFHGYSVADMYYILVDDISITTPSSAAEILTYTIPTQVSSTVNTGTATNGTVDIVMPYSTNLTALVPAITVSANATINPATAVAQNFTSGSVTYLVTAEDATTTKTWTVNLTTETQACTTPNALGSYGIGQTSANLNWTSTAANFNVQYRVNGTSTWTSTTSNNDTLLLSSLTAGTQYDFRVQAICSATAGDTSNWSSVANFTTVAVPVCNTPTALGANGLTQTSANIYWTSTAANFNVEYRVNGTSTWTSTTSSSTSLAINGLTANTQYDFRVQAVCSATAGDTSAWTSVSNFTTLAVPVCSTPTALGSFNIGLTSADIYWTSTAANFNVQYRVNGTSSWTSTTSNNDTLLLQGLTATTQYDFRVQAVCSATAGDTSAWSTVANFTTLTPQPCTTPTAIGSYGVTQTTANVYWTSTAANFKVQYRVNGSSTWTSTTSNNDTLLLSGLTAGTQYDFRVQAVCSATAGDTSAWTSNGSFTTLAAICNPPTALVVSAISASGATLDWTAGGTESAWNIRYKKVVDVTYTNVANTTIKPYILTGLLANTAYVWNVQAICSGTSSSVWSADNTFNTTVGISNNSINGLNVYSFNNQINVINNDNLLVKEVIIYDLLGKEVGKYAINSTDNILINTNFSVANYIVKVVTEKQVGTYKLFIK